MLGADQPAALRRAAANCVAGLAAGADCAAALVALGVPAALAAEEEAAAKGGGGGGGTAAAAAAMAMGALCRALPVAQLWRTGEVEDGGDRVAAHRRRRAVGVVARRDEGEQCAERAVGDERRRRVVGERGVGDGEGGVGDERRRRRRVARGGAERREEGGEAARAHELGASRRRLGSDGEDARRLLLDLDERRRRRRVVVGARLGADERDGTVEEAAVVKRGAQLGIVLEVGA